MELIYIAKSSSFPGIVKIGRTDVNINQRMRQLSNEDYGPSDFQGDSEWEAVRVFEVKNNEEAERILHDHFSSSRVESRRELFYSDNPDALADEAIEVVNGEYLVDLVDSFDVLLDIGATVVSIAGLTVLVQAFYPNSKTEKLINNKINFQDSLWNKADNSDNLLKRFLYGTAAFTSSWVSFMGIAAVSPFIAIVQSWKGDFNDYKKVDKFNLNQEVKKETIVNFNTGLTEAQKLCIINEVEDFDYCQQSWRVDHDKWGDREEWIDEFNLFYKTRKEEAENYKRELSKK